MVEKILVLGLMLLVAPEMASAQAAPAIPRCADTDNDLAQVRDMQAENPKTPAKYDGYRKVLEGTTRLELATRLAYAETLAANCPAQNEAVADIVATVIGNRIRLRGGNVASVVLQRDQFASSLNIYPESRYRDFLCPRDGELWKMVAAKMRAQLEGSAADASLPQDAVNYYLYLHSPRFKAPAWKLEEVPSTDTKTRGCIRTFRNPAWK